MLEKFYPGIPTHNLWVSFSSLRKNIKTWFKVTKDEWSMTNNSKKQLNYTIRNDYISILQFSWTFMNILWIFRVIKMSAKHIENLKEFSIPSFQSSASVTPEVPRTKLSSLIKSKSQKSSVNRLSTFSAIKWIIWPCLTLTLGQLL